MDDTKACPFCGETIKQIAIRCRYCHAELKEPDFDRHTEAPAKPAPGAVIGDDFEQRFLAFAYQPDAPYRFRPTEVAFALKIPIKTAEERLEDLAASDVLVRLVDDDGRVSFQLPGRTAPKPPQALMKRPPSHIGPGMNAPPSPQAMAGLLLNLVVPGVGSIVAGKTVEGVIQLVLILIGLPLCFILIGIPICIATWGWALSTGLRALHEGQTIPPDQGS